MSICVPSVIKLMKSNYEERMKAGKQLTLYESEVRVKAKQTEAESVVHDFTRAIIYWTTTF